MLEVGAVVGLVLSPHLGEVERDRARRVAREQPGKLQGDPIAEGFVGAFFVSYMLIVGTVLMNIVVAV